MNIQLIKKAMKLFYIFIFLISVHHVQAQYVTVGLDFALEWSAYQHYQRPSNHQFAQISGQKNSAGQILNVLPNARIGFVVYETESWGFGLHTGVTYSPFSLDIDQYKGMGAVGFPFIFSYQHHFANDFFMSIGGGVQFSKIEFSSKPLAFQSLENPYFMTYVGEIAMGVFSDYYVNIGITGFLRVGFHQFEAHTLDIGIRFNTIASIN